MRTNLLRSVLLLGAVFVFGTIGYHFIEGAGWFDSFYMTGITVTTVGYREVFPLSRTGEVFTIVLLLVGLAFILLVAAELGRTVLHGELRQAFGQARRSRMLERLSDHEIVCGWGRMGHAVVQELQRGGRPLVVVETKPEKIRRLDELGIPFVTGDATSETALRAAGVERARGLVACLNDDAHNVYTVLTARSLNPNLFIVARAGEEGAEERIMRAGANRVVNPYHHGGVRLAHVLVKPAVVDFLDFSLGSREHVGLELEQLHLAATSPLSGRTLAEADLRRKFGVGVVAVRRGAETLPNPEPDLRLAAADVLVVIGTRRQLDGFEKFTCSPEQVR